jgi:acyl carrier protein
MERDKIIEKTRKIINQVLKNEDFEWKDELTAGDIGGWDSLSHMLIIAEIENEFNIKFKLRDLNRIINLGSLISLIQSKL